MKHLERHLSHWQDTKSIERVKNSDKGLDFHKAEIENHLKEVALRFTWAPNGVTLGLWAKDIVDAGYKSDMVLEISKTIPFKFEKHPTLAQVMELLRPYAPLMGVLVDDLDDYSNRCFEHVKAKFLKIADDDIYKRYCETYRDLVLDGASHAVGEALEKCFLNDWLRTYFSKIPQDIINQGRVSNAEHLKGNREYFINPLRRYAKENKL